MSEGAGAMKAIRRTGKRIASARLDPFVVARVRFILFIAALMSLALAFYYADDWFVREFATYDWARDLGF
jgi:hypothetical protein